MILTLLISFFSSNYLIKLYIQNYTLFSIASIASLNIIGACIIIVMEKYKSYQVESIYKIESERNKSIYIHKQIWD